ncbi:hypothetical protein [Raoultibacter phocaeensis]|uniref:hypothetical protein n=1 Tax=Raoultibacter phocaeensis TaxID=2479841 RepID=UPI001118BA2E|nr:hypothetical protein [Raoultibacter phocaeensis]
MRDGATSQSDEARLGWAIFDDALERVNGYFSSLGTASLACAAADRMRVPFGCGGQSATAAAGSAEFLIVDEIGRLELEQKRGLDAAMRLLDEGPSPLRPCALVVVRDWLAGQAARRFEDAWGTPTVIGPDEAGWHAVLAAYGME